MSAAHASRTPRAVRLPRAWLAAWERAAQAARAVVADYRARRTVRELRELSDHLLADIGISRDQLHAAGRLERRL